VRLVPAVVVCLVVLAACGDDSSSSGSTSTAVTTAAATTTTAAVTTTSTVAPTTAPAPTTTTLAPATTKATTTTTKAAPTSTATTAASTTTKAASTGSYVKVTPPSMPDTTAPIPPEGSLPDGVYYATLVGANPKLNTLTVQIVQWFGGAACEAAATKYGGECDNDYFVLASPQRVLSMDVAQAVTTVAQPDQPGTSYRVPVAEFLRLVQAQSQTKSTPPAGPGSPGGYQFVPFGVRIEVKGTGIGRVDQVWTP
jgi:hypothetical protein